MLFSQNAVTRVFDCKRYSSKKLRRAVASTREQERHSGHSAFLADGTDSDVDPADPEQLLLPSLLPGAFLCHSLAGSEELTACRDGVFAVSVCQQAEMAYPHITRGQDMKEEPSDKFISLERHGLFAVIVCIISPEK